MASSRTTPDPKPAPIGKPADEKAAETAGSKGKHKDSARETIESIVVAFILAFLFRTFEAEAFVIPTGSMAPTLFGRHKDVACPQCGIHYEIGASEEVDKDDGLYLPVARIQYAGCPNCRYITEVRDLPVFKGDRILVNKFAYELSDPKRWDVVVFKYPEDPKTNYIKRLVGLPGETIEIRQGDVYSHTPDGATILRKDDPDKQRALQILVYDNDHPEKALLEKGWPERWAAVAKGDSPDAVAGWAPDPSGWKAAGDERAFELAAADPNAEPRWLRYRHFVPNTSDWDAVTADPPRAPRSHPPAQLITDFCGYNAYQMNFRDVEDGMYWVGDLTVSCLVEVKEAAADAHLTFELVEGGRRYRCRFDLSTGKAELFLVDGMGRDEATSTTPLASKETRVKGTGSWRIAFANVDDRLCVWVDDRLVDFGDEASYQPYMNLKLQLPWNEDLTPAGIAAQGATVRVGNLLLQRDVYYRGEYVRRENARGLRAEANSDFREFVPGAVEPGIRINGVEKDHVSEHDLRTTLTSPETWGEIYQRRWVGNVKEIDPEECLFPLAEDEFFMMGDNSPRSADSRLWPLAFRGADVEHRHAVKRGALVGKAFFIYWPHGVPFGNDGRGFPDGKDSLLNNNLTRGLFYHKSPKLDGGRIVGVEVSGDFYPSFRIPFYPQFSRMERIR